MERVHSDRSEQLYQLYKPLLFSLAYRMLGSVSDAEDIVQEAFLSWSERRPETVLNEKAYLCKMVTNRCVDRLRSPGKQREVYVGPWLPEPLITEALDSDSPSGAYLQKESLSTAYLLLLQQLSWVERAVFILREVLQYEYDEIAEIVDKSSSNCRQIFHRAKRSVSGLSGMADTVPLKSESLKALIEQFIHAVASGNTGQLMNLLKADVSMHSDGGGKVTAAVRPILGADRVIAFLMGIASKAPADMSFRIQMVNGNPGIVSYIGEQPSSVITFRMENDRIAEIYIVVNPDKLKHLPQR
ncbi:RNA polymerase sigma factor SigJ [Cohnella kolymensis]|uniref:RNA polymerase sigma factor SigJ n=1 Tax=Cohnella kolymensis TaxID=1590652 RepID=A0ABR5A5X0_9BACL|nr:RNA polymerase sigma-70 factor [Cohnella kolymensis]KIL36465.1 RNA polymerase sigma factor SigJ [Cohnella kolymensis]